MYLTFYLLMLQNLNPKSLQPILKNHLKGAVGDLPEC